jgi:hypothetical protein
VRWKRQNPDFGVTAQAFEGQGGFATLKATHPKSARLAVGGRYISMAASGTDASKEATKKEIAKEIENLRRELSQIESSIKTGEFVLVFIAGEFHYYLLSSSRIDKDGEVFCCCCYYVEIFFIITS